MVYKIRIVVVLTRYSLCSESKWSNGPDTLCSIRSESLRKNIVLARGLEGGELFDRDNV